jgi:hypothetical protein
MFTRTHLTEVQAHKLLSYVASSYNRKKLKKGLKGYMTVQDFIMDGNLLTTLEDIRNFFNLIDVATNDMTDLQVVFDYIDLMSDVIWYYIHNDVQFEAVTKGARYSFSVENWFTLRDETNN